MSNKTNIIIEELRGIAPHLADLQRVNPFTVPVHYFETLTEKTLQTVQASELPLLTSLKKENAFDVPYNYFESLPAKILNRVRQEESKPTFAETILHKLRFLLKPQYALATLALVVGITIFITKTNHPSSTPNNGFTIADAQKQITTQDVQDYISNNIDQFDENSIVACMTNKQVENAPFPMQSIDSLGVNLNQVDDYNNQDIAL